MLQLLKKNLSKTATQLKIINLESEVEAVLQQLNVDNVNVGSKLCDKCRRLVFFGTKKSKVDEQPSSSDQSQPTSSQEVPSSQSSGSVFEVKLNNPKEIKPTVELPLKRTFTSHSVCCVCKDTNK